MSLVVGENHQKEFRRGPCLRLCCSIVKTESSAYAPHGFILDLKISQEHIKFLIFQSVHKNIITAGHFTYLANTLHHNRKSTKQYQIIARFYYKTVFLTQY